MNDHDSESLENRLKELRKGHNLSQEELAQSLGISRQSVIAIEQGRSLPSIPLTISLCKFFNSTFEDFFNIHKEIEREMSNIISEVNNNFDSGAKSGRKEHKMPNEMEPWKPFREMVSLRDAMDRLFEDSFITPRGGAGMPKIDLKDEKDALVVRAELPGMAEEDVDVEVADGTMTISGEKKEEKVKEEEGYYHKESHTGSFTRSFTLPVDVMEEKAEAEMKDGVLTIRLPKVEPKKAKKLEIKKK